MFLLARWRRASWWMRSLLVIQLLIIVLALTVMFMVSYARHDIAAAMGVPLEGDPAAERALFRERLRFAGFSWGGPYGPLIRFNYATPAIGIYVEWSPKSGSIVSYASSKAALHANRSRPVVITPPPPGVFPPGVLPPGGFPPGSRVNTITVAPGGQGFVVQTYTFPPSVPGPTKP